MKTGVPAAFRYRCELPHVLQQAHEQAALATLQSLGASIDSWDEVGQLKTLDPSGYRILSRYPLLLGTIFFDGQERTVAAEDALLGSRQLFLFASSPPGDISDVVAHSETLDKRSTSQLAIDQVMMPVKHLYIHSFVGGRLFEHANVFMGPDMPPIAVSSRDARAAASDVLDHTTGVHNVDDVARRFGPERVQYISESLAHVLIAAIEASEPHTVIDLRTP